MVQLRTSTHRLTVESFMALSRLRLMFSTSRKPSRP